MSFVSPTSLNFPSYVNGKVLSPNGEDFSPDWNIYFAQQSQQLQINFSSSGITLPSQTTAEIADLVTFNNGPFGNGRFNNKVFVNSDTGDVDILLNGVLTPLLSQRDFVPTMSDTAGNQPVYATQLANFTQLGNRVFINMDLAISAKGAVVGADPIRINLPNTVTSFNQTGSLLPGNAAFIYPANATVLVPQTINGQTYMNLSWVEDTGVVTDAVWNDMSATGSLTLNINYKV
jgi:hypothetical protein